MHQGSRRAGALSLAAWLASTGCNPPVREAVGVPTAPVVPAGPSCAPTPAGALALVNDEPCPWVLVAGEAAAPPMLRSGDPASGRSLSVAVPDECAGRCEFTGTSSALGPVLLATRSDPAGERVEAAFVGVALGGDVVHFAPLWFGLAARGDSTVLGPPHTLAPWVCGDALVLAVEGRLPASEAEEPVPGIVRAAGVYALLNDQLQRSDRVAPTLRGCTRVPLELP